jgi:hypothetical protein
MKLIHLGGLHASIPACLTARVLTIGMLMATLPASAIGINTKSEAASAQPQQTYTPSQGESLDHVIQQTFADSPLKIELLRQAYISINPKSFATVKTLKPRAGIPMLIPDHERLLHNVITASQRTEATQSNRSDSLYGATDNRRHWVRFP